MGTVDIEQTVEEVLQSDNILWDGETPSYDQMEGIVREVVVQITEWHYSMNDGEIDDWDIWEQDIVCEVNNRLERLNGDGGVSYSLGASRSCLPSEMIENL